MKQLFHMPNDDGAFGPCDPKRACSRDEHDTSCAQKCHQDHQVIDVKGKHATYVLVDDHGAHTIVEHALTPSEFDAVQHIKNNVMVDCADCEFEVWTLRDWQKEAQRLGDAQLSNADRRKPVTK